MSLDFYIEKREREQVPCVCQCGHTHTTTEDGTLFTVNITHNLGRMFHEAGVADILWHGDGRVAGSVVDRLDEARRVMADDPERFRKFDAPNGWGTYDHAMNFISEVIAACRENPEGVIRCLG